VSEFAASRKNGGRPKGYAPWRPQAKSRVLLGQVQEILTQYADQLPLTVRQIFYRLVGAYGYAKTEAAYERLGNLLVRARRAQLIAFDDIRDDGVVTYSSRWHAGVEDFWDDAVRRAQNYQRDRQAGQQQHVELWAEAAGMAPQLARIADDYSVPVFSSGGFSSLSAVRLIAGRACRRDVPTVILHVGDFDPSGESIFEAVTADAAAFVEADRVILPQRIIPLRVALTADQVEAYDLETAPAKRTDSRSAKWDGETCQLEALAPDELADIVRHAINEWFGLQRLAEEIEAERGDRLELLKALPMGHAT
jgi:hypothetical protein